MRINLQKLRGQVTKDGKYLDLETEPLPQSAFEQWRKTAEIFDLGPRDADDILEQILRAQIIAAIREAIE